MKITYLSAIGSNQLSWFVPYVELAIKIALEEKIKISDSGSEGGYLSMFEPQKNAPPKMELVTACGEFPFEKRMQYFWNSQEKAVRLNDNIQKLGHYTSRQSMNEIAQEWPGAIYFREENKILSFSGLNPPWDEFMDVLVSWINYYLSKKMQYGKQNIDLADKDVQHIFFERLDMVEVNHHEKHQMLFVAKKIMGLE